MKRFAVALGLALAAAASGATAENESTFEAIKIQAGKALYDAECHRCHATDAEDASYGPPLQNIIGRGAGTVEDYDYSIALEASGIVWTQAALRAWMEDNKGFMPGTKMRHVGIQDSTAQDFVLAYLASISDGTSGEISETLDGN